MTGKNRLRVELLGEEESQLDCNRQNIGLNALVRARRGGHARRGARGRVFFSVLSNLIEIKDKLHNQLTQPHTWCQVRESNPGHIRGRRVLSVPRHLCFPETELSKE